MGAMSETHLSACSQALNGKRLGLLGHGLELVQVQDCQIQRLLLGLISSGLLLLLVVC